MKKLIFLIILLVINVTLFGTQYSPPFAGDYTLQMVTGDLTETGVQYTDSVATTTANVSVTVFQDTIDIHLGDYSDGGGVSHFEKQIYNVYIKAIAEIRADASATAKVYLKLQAKDLNKDEWSDISDWTACATAIGTSYVEKELSGFCQLTTNFSKLPFEYRVVMKCDTANEGIGRMKSGSYVRVVFLIY